MLKRSLFTKIRDVKSFDDLLKKIGNKINHYRQHGTFIIHNLIVRSIYGETEVYDYFQVSDEDVLKIRKELDSSKELKLSNNPSKGKVGNNLDEELYAFMNQEQTWFEIKKNSFFDDFLNKIKPSIKKFLKSPFIVVHLNAWKTRPNMRKYFDADGNQRGPNRMHRDGYPPGHFKCLIYLQPLDKYFGTLQVTDKVFESKRAGFTAMFNPNYEHQSITGSSNYRYVLELTLMRTITEVDMLKYYEGTVDDKWFSHALRAYI